MYIRRILVIVALLIALGMAGFSYFVYNTLLVPNTAFEEDYVNIYIKSNSNYSEVYHQLEPLLKHPEKFDIVASQKKYINNIRPGRYILSKDMTNNDIITVLRSRNTPVSVVFNNQERLPQLAGRIAQQIEADSLELLQTMTDSVFLSLHDFKTETALNMYIPNKYEFYWNTSAERFRERMLSEYKRFWNEKRLAQAEKIGLSPSEVQNLASIVQKETSMVDERQRVAGVYMNRIKNGWKLEADPTVIYALKNRGLDYDTTTIKRVLYKDLKVESPYNTYLNEGIPPGPIAMADISSIDAVLNYENHDYFFFVADPSNPGYHKFAKTYAQHNRNKNEYVRWLSKMKINR